MKRYGKENTLEALKNGCVIGDYAHYMLYAGFKVVNSDYDVIGFITFDLFCSLIRQGIITISFRDYGVTYYELNKENKK